MFFVLAVGQAKVEIEIFFEGVVDSEVEEMVLLAKLVNDRLPVLRLN